MTDQPPPPPPGYTPYGQQPVPQTSSDAIAALVLAILSWAVCPLVLAIAALVFASRATRAIAMSNGWVEGSGMVLAAKIIAWINIVVSVLFFGVLMFGLLAAGSWQ